MPVQLSIVQKNFYFLILCISFSYAAHTSIVPEEINPPPALRATLPKMQEYLSSPMKTSKTAEL